jgi:uncharacterized protein (TIGR00369 family)
MALPFPATIENLQHILNSIRHCEVLQLTIEQIDTKLVTISLPYSSHIIGNPDSGVIHGGALTTLMDTTCGLAVLIALQELQLTPTLDLRIDYMSAATPGQSVYGRAEAYRITNNVVFCKGIAFQDDDSKPIAHCVATFMRLPKELTQTHQGSPA